MGRIVYQATCVEIKRIDGSSYRVPLETNIMLTNGDLVVGRAKNCDGVVGAKLVAKLEVPIAAREDIYKQLAREGIKVGDAIAWASKQLHIRQCAPCKARQVILNNITKLGFSETLRQIKETFRK